MNISTSGGSLFESGCDLFEVTSNHRPDTAWRHVDPQGHEHRWYSAGQPSESYNPATAYETPTLVWVKDGEEYWDGDDEPHPVGHLECAECGAHVTPKYTADTHQQFVPGLRWFKIDGVRVTEAEYRLQLGQKSP